MPGGPSTVRTLEANFVVVIVGSSSKQVNEGCTIGEARLRSVHVYMKGMCVPFGR